MTNKPKEEILKEFDRKFHYENGEWIYRYFENGDSANGLAQPQNFKQFLSKAIDKAVTEERERIINTVMEVKYDDLGMGKMSKDEKMGVNAFKMYLKYKLRTKP